MKRNAMTAVAALGHFFVDLLCAWGMFRFCRPAENWMEAEREYMMCTLMRKVPTSASLCVRCGKCEQHCPQGIAIRNELANAAKVLEGPFYRIAGKVLPIFMKQ